ncbi:hypothetical protein SAMN05428944_2497 [Streptomyces sp. 1222.5]|uniref:hypothetical protein n=1 Tax=unclassified Streptomyces TaxID=2593676 RepID=UPI00089AF09D|nr:MULTISPECIES: hypothetical protein [unclassified Streptomyces]PKW10317.1 hypothetical protein BX260_5594 [Streptomyces sp. 5112.2]SEC09247.1 hypothetical protein SAMN05428944_2497 [Streptomyces sp. 1222.5]
MADSYFEAFLSDTDGVPAGSERDVSALTESPSDERVLHIVERVVLALNEVYERHESSGWRSSLPRSALASGAIRADRNRSIARTSPRSTSAA